MTKTGKKVTTFRERFSVLIDEFPGSATDLAASIGVSKQTVSAWKCGERSPNRITTVAIASFFSVNIDWLYGYDVERYAKPKTLPDNVIDVKSIGLKSIPLIGSVAAGEPILACETHDLYIDSPVQADYALKVKGDSMEPVYIDGDVVYIRQVPDVRDGTVAVVLLDDEACIKHVYHIENGVQLVSNNPKYPPMIRTWPETDNIRILGVVVGFTRMYK